MATVTTPEDAGSCSCGEGSTAPGPRNPPGRPALAYRLGTHATFLREMLERLPEQAVPDGPNAGARPLAALARHSDRDPAIALLDAFSMVADVLTFYQERLVNEGFLRTAVDPRSVQELSRELGGGLQPGVAAGTWLQFTVEDAPGAPRAASLPAGVLALSIPAQDQRPQPFETVEALEARAEWNELTPRRTAPLWLGMGDTRAHLRGLSTGLKPGDVLLIVGPERERSHGSERWDARQVSEVTPIPELGVTRVTWARGLGKANSEPARPAQIHAMRVRANLFGHNAPDWRAMPDTIKRAYDPEYPANQRADWPGMALAATDPPAVDLDREYPGVLAGSWVLLAGQTHAELYRAAEVGVGARADFTLNGKTTRITLDTSESVTRFSVRGTVAFTQSERLEQAEEPLQAPLELQEIPLEARVAGLEPRRALVVAGRRPRATVAAGGGALRLVSEDGLQEKAIIPGDSLLALAPAVASPVLEGGQRWRLRDADGFEGRADLLPAQVSLQASRAEDEEICEVAVLDHAAHDAERTTLHLSRPLERLYDRATARIHANVARATHGETVREVLGSGDGGRVNQRFTLSRSPLTWVQAATAGGRRSTLEIRVNGALWQEVGWLHDRGPGDRVYVLQQDGQGKATAVFGDGVHGARLPSGQQNVTAVYRVGIGTEGAVATGSIKLLQARPLGIRSVTNPLPATGAQAPDTAARSRWKAPESVLDLGRIISAADHESFARSFAGVGKARAALMWNGARRLVHVTLGLAAGAPPRSDDAILGHLAAAMDSVRDRTVDVELAGYEPRWLRVAATLQAAGDRLFEDVAAAARRALVEAFSFERRAFAQGASASEVIALLQGVEGVELVDLDGLAFIDAASGPVQETVTAWLAAQDTRWEVQGDVEKVRPAQLLCLDPSPYGVTLRNRAQPEEEPQALRKPQALKKERRR